MTSNELPSEAHDLVVPEIGLLSGFTQSLVGRVVVAIASAAVLMPIAATTAQYNHIELVQPISTSIQTLAVVLGVFVGAVLAQAWMVAWRQGHMKFLSRLSLGCGVTATGHNVRSDERASRSLGGWLLTLVLAVGAVLTATKLAREAVMWHAFAGATTTVAPERFTIVGKIHEGRRTRAHLEIRLATGGRTFNFQVSTEAFASAQRGKTLLLPVETGRGGLQRMVPPTGPIEPGDLQTTPIGSQ
jgi:hypothetical protein